MTSRTKTEKAPSQGKATVGRPRKAQGPKLDYNELDRLLVFGEVRHAKRGETTVEFLSYRQLAERFGVSHSVIAEYARRHNCKQRRSRTQARVEARTEEKMVEVRAEGIAVSKERAIHMLDQLLLQVEEAIEQGRIRMDDPNSISTILRLKEFLMGGAESRQEVMGSMSLEALQTRHKEMLRRMKETTPAERGVVETKSPPLPTGVVGNERPPASPLVAGTENTTWSLLSEGVGRQSEARMPEGASSSLNPGRIGVPAGSGGGAERRFGP